MEYDIAVIGGGPAGYSAALKGARMGAKVVLFERENLGGVCLNAGCIPTKSYVAQAELIEKIRQNTQLGIFKEAGVFSFKKIFEQKQKVVAKLTGGIDALLRAAKVEVIRGEALPKDAHTIEAGGKTYRTKKILLATGSRNFIPPIPGVDGVNVLDSTGLLAMQRLPESLVIVGAGVIGLEFACIMNAFGCEVTAVDVLPEILPNEDRETVQALFALLKQQGIKFELSCRVVRIEDVENGKRVTVEQDGELRGLGAEYVLIGVGREPDNEVAKELGLELDQKGFVKVDAKLRTSQKDVYAAGDLIGGCLLAHSAYEEAETAVQNCLGADKTVNLNVMPRCIFTSPPYAAVGVAEQNATGETVSGKFPFGANGKAIAGGIEEGFIKWIAEKETGKLIGCSILGGEAAEMVSTALVAVNGGMTAKELAGMIFPHPTLSEGIKEAAADIMGEALHLPERK